ncbi:expressed unknown protein [Seminavis robusta]|uniref:Uncharacterized protein n=1 Tax=Seminavis robusta TaxID=568900 RepID=A0A9N8E0F0_9STRA|nr:expressed unknown protein [Seminavis robusta]|eukprot:Sro438_g143000.1 n/a (1608) ;mRNA; f:21495-26318
MSQRPRWNPRRRHGGKRGVSLFLVLTLFLGLHIEILKWEIANFVLNNDNFNQLLQHNFLSGYNNLQILRQLQSSKSRALVQDVESMDIVPVNAFHFGFFDNLYGAPTQEEYEGLLCQTKAFYLDIFQLKLGSFIYVNLYSANWTYAPDQQEPISHTVVVHATFEDGVPLPPEEVNQAVRASSMAHFIEKFVWAAEPRGQNDERGAFYDTNTVTAEVGLYERQYQRENLEIGNIVLGSSLTCPANGYYEATLELGFFPGHSRKPTNQEIQDLIPLSEKFFTRTLQSTYTTRQVSVQLELMGWQFDDSNNNQLPLSITFHLSGTFDYGGGDVVPLEYIKEKLAHDKPLKETIMQDYIKEAAWEVPPFKESTFWDVNRARMNSKLFRYKPKRDDANGIGGDSTGPASGNNGGQQPQQSNGFGGPGGLGFPGGSSGSAGPGGSFPLRAGSFDLLGDNNATDPNDPTRTTVFNMALQPLTIPDDECREHLSNANADLDRFLTTDEYATFVNSMTNDFYAGYPYAALPDVFLGVFEDMSLRNEAGQEAIDLLGAFEPDISQENLNLLEKTRANKICKYIKSSANTAIAQAPVMSTKLNSTVGFYLGYQQADPAAEGPDMSGLDTGFQNFVGDMVGPAVQATMTEGLRKNRRELTRRELALQALRRHLQDGEAAFVMPSSAKMTSVEETECRGPDAGDPEMSCYNAEAGLDVFLKGNEAPSMAPEVGSMVEDTMEESIVNGDLQAELQKIDPNWRVRTLHAPTAAPSVAPSASPSATTPAPTEAPKKSFAQSLTEDSAGVATAATGAVILMIAIQCGREFLIDLFIKLCKMCCVCLTGRRRDDDDDEEETEYASRGDPSGEFDETVFSGQKPGEEDHNDSDEGSEEGSQEDESSSEATASSEMQSSAASTAESDDDEDDDEEESEEDEEEEEEEDEEDSSDSEEDTEGAQAEEASQLEDTDTSEAEETEAEDTEDNRTEDNRAEETDHADNPDDSETGPQPSDQKGGDDGDEPKFSSRSLGDTQAEGGAEPDDSNDYASNKAAALAATVAAGAGVAVAVTYASAREGEDNSDDEKQMNSLQGELPKAQEDASQTEYRESENAEAGAKKGHGAKVEDSVDEAEVDAADKTSDGGLGPDDIAMSGEIDTSQAEDKEDSRAKEIDQVEITDNSAKEVDETSVQEATGPEASDNEGSDDGGPEVSSRSLGEIPAVGEAEPDEADESNDNSTGSDDYASKKAAALAAAVTVGAGAAAAVTYASVREREEDPDHQQQLNSVDVEPLKAQADESSQTEHVEPDSTEPAVNKEHGDQAEGTKDEVSSIADRADTVDNQNDGGFGPDDIILPDGPRNEQSHQEGEHSQTSLNEAAKGNDEVSPHDGKVESSEEEVEIDETSNTERRQEEPMKLEGQKDEDETSVVSSVVGPADASRFSWMGIGALDPGKSQEAPPETVDQNAGDDDTSVLGTSAVESADRAKSNVGEDASSTAEGEQAVPEHHAEGDHSSVVSSVVGAADTSRFSWMGIGALDAGTSQPAPPETIESNARDDDASVLGSSAVEPSERARRSVDGGDASSTEAETEGAVNDEGDDTSVVSSVVGESNPRLSWFGLPKKLQGNHQ